MANRRRRRRRRPKTHLPILSDRDIEFIRRAYDVAAEQGWSF